MTRNSLVSLALAALVLTGAGCAPTAPSPATPPSAVPPVETSIPSPKPSVARTFPGKLADAEILNKQVRISTAKGDIVLELFGDKTPLTVSNFVALAKDGYYDGLKFHRVIEDFMIQGGDPTGTGSGGPGYQFGDEFVPSLKFVGPGQLAMANAGPGTNGSQFFITHIATPWLTGKHTIFGQVLSGQDVVNAIAQGDVMTKVSVEDLKK